MRNLIYFYNLKTGLKHAALVEDAGEEDEKESIMCW